MVSECRCLIDPIGSRYVSAPRHDNIGLKKAWHGVTFSFSFFVVGSAGADRLRVSRTSRTIHSTHEFYYMYVQATFVTRIYCYKSRFCNHSVFLKFRTKLFYNREELLVSVDTFRGELPYNTLIKWIARKHLILV